MFLEPMFRRPQWQKVLDHFVFLPFFMYDPDCCYSLGDYGRPLEVMGGLKLPPCPPLALNGLGPLPFFPLRSSLYPVPSPVHCPLLEAQR